MSKKPRSKPKLDITHLQPIFIKTGLKNKKHTHTQEQQWI